MNGFTPTAKKYDPKLLEGRITAEAAVIGLIINDIDILTDYNLTSNFFISEDGNFIFKILKSLHDKGITEVSDFDISMLGTEIYKKFLERGGMNLINSMKEEIELANYSAYIDELYKHKAIIDLADKGFNLFQPMEFNGKKVIPIEFFKKCKSEEVKEFYDYHINEIDVFSLETGKEEIEIDIDDDFLLSCENGDEIGLMFDTAGKDIDNEIIYVLPSISKQIGGYLKGTLNCIAGYSNIGKSTFTNGIMFSLVSKGCNVLFISNEQKSKVFKTSYLLWILTNKLRYFNITRQKLRSGNLSNEDKEMLKKAQKIWRDEYKGHLHFVGLNEANIKEVVKKIREYKVRKNVDVVIYDTFKTDFENNNDADWKSLIKDSRELFKTIKKYDIIGICTMQLAPSTKGKLFLNESVLANGKQVKEIFETLLLIRGVYNSEELDRESRYYMKPFRRTLIAGQWIPSEMVIEKDKVYRVLFVDKAREGETSESTGEAYLLSFDGSKGLFKEVSQCKPKHGFIQ
jgi:KaiC/GvpD/RAD55 family RecA-like ATPase